MTYLRDAFINSVEDRILAIRQKLASPPYLSTKPRAPGRAIDQDFVDEIRWRIEVSKKLIEVEEMVEKHLSQNSGCPTCGKALSTPGDPT